MIPLRRVMFMWLMVGVTHAAFADDAVKHATGSAMGMKWSVKWIGSMERGMVEKETVALLTEIERQMSTYRVDSEISRFNASISTDWFPVSTNLARVVDISLDIARKAEGALDPTVFPLVQVWGFGPGRRAGHLPTVKEIAAAKARVGYTNLQVRLHPPALRKVRADLAIDVNAVAMGYAADLLAARFQQHGSTNHLVDMGGEFVARGAGPTGQGWPVGIEQPDSDGRRIARTIFLNDQALATSGDDRNFREVNGRRYHHIINPHTGWPAELQVASATVIHTSCASADGWATALIVLGEERGRELSRTWNLEIIIQRRIK